MGTGGLSWGRVCEMMDGGMQSSVGSRAGGDARAGEGEGVKLAGSPFLLRSSPSGSLEAGSRLG